MSQGSSSVSQSEKDFSQELTMEDISMQDLSEIPLVCCPDCGGTKKVLLLSSKQQGSLGAWFVKCEKYGNGECKFFRWLSAYVKHLKKSSIHEPAHLLGKIEVMAEKKKRMKKPKSNVIATPPKLIEPSKLIDPPAGKLINQQPRQDDSQVRNLNKHMSKLVKLQEIQIIMQSVMLVFVIVAVMAIAAKK